MCDQEIYDILQRTQNAYAFRFYTRASWIEIIIFLAEFGLRAIQIEAVLMSKMMRHAAEASDMVPATRETFKAYLKTLEKTAPLSEKKIQKFIDELYGKI
jgi:hypothetical protein